MANLAYVTLAVGIKARLPSKIYGFLVINILITVLSFKTKLFAHQLSDSIRL
jgi:hypothetical protein